MEYNYKDNNNGEVQVVGVVRRVMSGLTMELMSRSLVDFEVFAKFGIPKDCKHAGTFFFLLHSKEKDLNAFSF